MPSCRLKNVLADALKVFFEKLDSVTLADLMADAQDPPAVIRTVGFSLSKKKGASVKTA
jgi:DNA-binding IscR family transcriptional regulator